MGNRQPRESLEESLSFDDVCVSETQRSMYIHHSGVGTYGAPVSSDVKSVDDPVSKSSLQLATWDVVDSADIDTVERGDNSSSPVVSSPAEPMPTASTASQHNTESVTHEDLLDNSISVICKEEEENLTPGNHTPGTSFTANPSTTPVASPIAVSNPQSTDCDSSITGTVYRLHQACQDLNWEAFCECPRTIANVKVKNKAGNTPLHLLVDIDLQDGSSQASVQYEMIQQLLEHGPAVCIADQAGNHPLHLACVHGATEIARLLLKKYGADTAAQNNEGETALHLACRGNHPSIVELLVSHDPSSIDARTMAGNTPLHLAALIGNTTIVNELLRPLASHEHQRIIKPNKDLNTPLHLATEQVQTEVVRILLAHCCSSSALVNYQNKNGDTALHIACRKESREMVRILVQHGAEQGHVNGERKELVPIENREAIMLGVHASATGRRRKLSKNPWKRRKSLQLVTCNTVDPAKSEAVESSDNSFSPVVPRIKFPSPAEPTSTASQHNTGALPDTVQECTSAQPKTKHTVLCEEKILRSKIMPAHDFPDNLVDPLEVILCDEFGGIYHNPMHGITLRIPEGAIPAGLKLEISIGVVLHGNFDFPSGLSPVSAIVWLCTPQPNFTFLKPVEIIIPHFMNCTSNGDAAHLQMQFMKASHWSPDKANVQFGCADGVQNFGAVAYKGVIHTRHFCRLCIASGISCEGRRLCISCAKSRSQLTKVIFFYITYLLETCLRYLDSKLPGGYYIAEKRSFQFQTARLRPGISIDCQSSERLEFSLQPTKISQDKVNFWQLHRDGDLKVMEDNGLYPPKMVLETTEIPSIPVTVTVTFRGILESKEETMMQITLPYNATPSAQPGSHLAEVADPVLTDSPTIHQLWFLRGDDQKDSIRLIDELTPEWERFGYMLDFDRRGSHMAFIKAQYVREGAMACCNRVLVDWLNGRGTHQPPTWANLISILKDIDECRVLAQRLQTYFGT